MAEYKILNAGDTALVVEFGNVIDRGLNLRVLALARRLRECKLEGLVETVPTFRSLMVHYDPLVLSEAALVAHIKNQMGDLPDVAGGGRHWRLPVCYDSRLAPDIDEVAAHVGLSSAQVVERHSGQTYHVYMLGFLPGQAYLGDVPVELALPRRQIPRRKIPAGSLAIAMTMTCIFPLETPCGWHLIGRSPIGMWDKEANSGALLAPGDEVTFAPVSYREYEDLAAKIAGGMVRIEPCGRVLGSVA
jgi:inhibitor of KinA